MASSKDSQIFQLKFIWNGLLGKREVSCGKEDMLLCEIIQISENLWMLLTMRSTHGNFSWSDKYNCLSPSECQCGYIVVFEMVTSSSESPFSTTTTCSTDISLLKRILSLCRNSMDGDYFPWDTSALSLSIFVLSLHHCFTVHLFIRSVPFIGDFHCKGRPQSISSISENPDGHHIKDMDSVMERKGQNKSDMLNNYHELKERPVVLWEDPCKQIHTCSCSGSDSRMLLLKDDAWLHCKLHSRVASRRKMDPFPPIRLSYFFRTVFLIHLLSTSLVSTASAVTLDASLEEIQSTPSPSSRSMVELFCDQYPLKKFLNKSASQECHWDCCDTKGCDCCGAINSVIDNDKKAQADVSEFYDTMSKYATAKTYSVQWPFDDGCCKIAYKNWICSYYHQYYDDGENGEKVQKTPCLSICTRVETSCPFFRVHHDTKLYGGQPTFLCRGFKDQNLTLSSGCYDMNESACLPRYEFDGPDDEAIYESASTKWTQHADNFTTQLLNSSPNPIEDLKSLNLSSGASSNCCVYLWLNLILYVLSSHLISC